ncbi:MAG: SGNH/GDSL hydrolase family protein, partial [Mycobacterium sp.]|nr:SGNH/GDSL hydrolase family protein [Mycobacterium sp.]
GLRLARAQAVAVRAAGGVPVPLANLLASDFLHSAAMLLSEDQYHPSAAGYALVADQLLPALCDALGESSADLTPALLSANEPVDTGHRSSSQAIMSRLLRRHTTGVPAPVVMPAGE